MKGTRISYPLLVILYLLAFILIREWLLPVMELTKTSYMSLFLIFVGLSFLLALFNAKWWISVPLKILYILWAVQMIYNHTPLISLEGSLFVFQSIGLDVSSVVTGEWQQVSNVSRTLLFFLLLWMITYLIHYWIEVKRSLFLFYFTTVAFLATLDTFSSYSVNDSILPVMVVGLLLLGLLTIIKLLSSYQLPFNFKKIMPMFVPLIFLLVVSTVFMTVLPKFAPMWSDPVPFIKSMAKQDDAEGQTVSKSGYGTNDEQLGGPFLEDDSLVFEAAVKNRQYWKVETKDTYTSKGWEQSKHSAIITQLTPGEPIGSLPDDHEIEHATLTMIEKFPFILYPYGLTKMTTEHDAVLNYDQLIGKYETSINDVVQPIDAYDLEFVEHAYSLKELRETSMDALVESPQFEPYLQLPETLPERVEELAQSITASSESVYEKAKAIERYFSQNGFVYEQADVAIPDEDEDYVDQFLFDTKKGYCDNFSTSMVVMLRTLDIPARWTKGFAPGELSRNDENEQVYRVSNNEAHSWVEAYMPEIGWVPFEPTIGFSGVTDIDYDIELTSDDPAVNEMPEQEREELEQEIKEKETEEKKQADKEEVTFDIGDWLTKSVRFILLGLAVFAAIVLFIYLSRRRWLPHLLIRRYRLKEADWNVFKEQYVQLLKQLDRYGLKRAPNETLATYAVQVDDRFGGENMQEITAIYEKGIYGEIEKSQEWQRLQKMWEDLIIKTSN